MTWREKKLQARFRGIQFNVEAHDRSGSRRLAVTEIPLGDEPIIQDMGAGLQRFRLEAFILGLDYMPRRDALLRALEGPGPGLLMHPWHGQHRVVVETFTVKEGVTAGGRVDFSIQFLRVGPLQGRKRHGASRAARVAAVNVSAAKVSGVASESFVDALRIAGVAGFVADAAEDEVRGFAARIESQARHLQGKSAGLLRKVRKMADAPLKAMLNPSGLAVDIFDAVQEVGAGIKSRDVALRVLLGMTGSAVRPAAGQSGQAEIAKENARGFTGLFAAAALGAACKRAASEEWPSRESALEARARIVSAADEIGGGVSHPVWQELHGLVAALSDVLPGPQGDLPEIQVIELGAPEPALVLAYRLHGSVSGVQDLVERNGVSHPLFLPAAMPVEVLVDA